MVEDFYGLRLGVEGFQVFKVRSLGLKGLGCNFCRVCKVSGTCRYHTVKYDPFIKSQLAPLN